MRLKLPVLAVLAALAPILAPTLSNAGEVTVNGVTVAHPWARATPEGAKIGAAFAEIKTDKDTADRLIGVSSPVAGRAEIHSMIMDGDVMKMRRLDGIDMKPGETLVLKPMDVHVMLFDLKQPLKERDPLKLTLTFAKAGPIEVEGTVEPLGAKGPQSHESHDSQSADDAMGADHHQHNHTSHD